ncbi:cadherin-related family member 5 [Pseudochaenichthys georgianus]|uniref:cadherin-related family member 5 n=1 Tax=Pseudochaenichthys georgianus TaxID=52239 RepID=UPI00146AC66E|nr:cadherin-related family member 5 [Pseudochaenichthys georgianus]
MALNELKWSCVQATALVHSLLVLLCLHTATGMSGWGGCLDGQDVFTKIPENSHWGDVVAELMDESTVEGVHWSLEGNDADWFFLDETSIRLNTSEEKVLDREAQGPVLMAELSCYEDDTLQSVYRIVVEILNENDNTPEFTEDTITSLTISELTPVNTVVFTIKASDADNDKIIYSIDQASPDAEYFKIDLPNSGEVILSKSLDYETKTQLTVTIHASEMDTAEHFNTSTTLTIIVQDGDDQYPEFLPCRLLFQDETSHICTSPVYTVNVTEGEEDVVLDFSPGPIHAVDGDRGLSSPLSYVILSGDDDGRFLMDRDTGEVKLMRGVKDRLTTPELHLQVMVYQDDDPRKYSVATALVRVLAVNQFHPEFDMAEYKGFVTATKSPASVVNTYGSKALMLHVQDKDFNNGFNPKIHFTISPTSNHTDIFQITHEGLLIARTNQLKPKQKQFVKVAAVDQESGDATFATVVVEVLSEGQSIPHSPLMDDRVIGCTLGKAFFLSMVFMTVIGIITTLGMWQKKKKKGMRNPLQRGCVAQGKHRNVSLRWFQLASHRSGMSNTEEIPYNNDEYGTCNPSFSFTDNPGVYTHQDLPSCRGPVPPRTTAAPDTSFIPAESALSPVIFNNVLTPPQRSYSLPTLHPASEEVSPTHTAQMSAPSEEYPDSPTDTSIDLTEDVPIISPSPATPDSTGSPPFTCPDSQTTKTTTSIDPTDSFTSQSQSSVPFSLTQIASAEIDKPFRKPRVKTPPYSPLLSSPLAKQMRTSPPTPEHAPLKARLVLIDTSPLDTPPETPQRPSLTPITEGDQPSTSQDLTERSGGAAGAGTQSQVMRRFTHFGKKQGGSGARDVADDGNPGNKDGGKHKNEDDDDDDDLESDEEELLRVMARCNPVFITFNT